MTTRIDESHDDYGDLYVCWHEAGKPRTFRFGGYEYFSLNDNEGMVFLLLGEEQHELAHYASTSFISGPRTK